MSTDKQMFTDWFNRADKDDSKSLTLTELGDVLRLAGVKDEQICKMYRDLDKNGDDEISLQEYLSEMMKRSAKDLSDADLRSAFRTIDTSGDNKITRTELEEVVKAQGRTINKAKMDVWCKNLDKDGDGMITYEEFIEECDFLFAQ